MTKKPLKILFFGTADFSASFLTSILKSQHKVEAVVTGLDKVSGRGKKVQMPKVKEIALEHNIPVWQFPTSLRHPENYEKLLKNYNPDIMVVVAFGDILPVELIHSPKYQSINVHPSLLPFGRGASPVQSSIANNDAKTAFCIIKMDATLDTGDILLWKDVDIDPKETSETLFQKLSDLGGPLLNNVLDNIEDYLAKAEPQKPLNVAEPKKTYTRKIKKSYGKFKAALTATEIDCKRRAYTPWPGLFFTSHLNGEEIKIIESNSYNSFSSFVEKVNREKEHLNFLANVVTTEVQEDQRLLESFAKEHKEPLSHLTLGTIFAVSKKNIYVLCGNNTILEINQVQLPGKKVSPISAIKNGYPELFALGACLL